MRPAATVLTALVLSLASGEAAAGSESTGTWIKIADEGQAFTVIGAQTVRYGAGANWITLSVAGGGACSNAYFGSDPAVNTVKECDRLDTGSTPAPTSLLANSSFETPTVGGGNFQYGVTGGSWVFDAAGLTGNGSGFTSDNAGAPDSTQVAFIQYAGSAKQTLTLAAGTYSLTMQGAQRGGSYYASSIQVIRVLVDGTAQGDFTPPRGGYGASPVYTFAIATAGSHTITLAGVGSGSDYTAFIDSVMLTRRESVSATLPPPPISAVPVVNYEYDAQGNPTKTIVAPAVAGFNHATQSVYDPLNRATAVIDARGKTTRIAYDGLGRPVQVTDPRSLVTQTPRNGLGDTTAVASPDIGTATSTYDAAGNLKTRQDSRGVLATYGYDPLNRLASVVYSGQTYTWTYDQTGTGYAYGIGRLTSTTHPSGRTQYAYDPQGRLTSDTQQVDAAAGANPAALAMTVTYGYDAAGHVTRITYPSGRVVSMSYTGGLPSALSLAANGTATPVRLLDQIEFAPFGGVTGWHWQMAGSTQASNRVYDGSGRLVRYPLGPVVRDLSYDAAGRITDYTHYDALAGAATSASSALDQHFGYDELGRLTTVVAGTSTWTIGYDDNGNRTSVTLGATTSTYTTSPTSNRLTGVANPTLTRTLQYDNAGNTTSDSGATGSGYTSTYDVTGRLATLTRAGATVSFSYDGAGRRLRKFVSAGTGAGAATTVLFVYGQDGQLLGEYDQAGNALREYVWLGTRPVVLFTPDASNVANPPVAYFVHTDHLDTPRVVVDRNNQVRWRWMAEPFGTTAPEDNPSGVGVSTQNLRFPGQYADRETGLNYNYSRDYDSSTGRYAQSDPIGLAGGINTYTYVEGNPVSYSDPLGLKTFMCTKPLHGLGEKWGPRMYPESRWNPSPAYHQFLCVKDATGKITCGGQDRSGSAFVPGSPGKPSDDSWPTEGNGSCEPKDDRDCVDQCVIKAVNDPKRPWYAIGPQGTDCQEWADEVIRQCQKQCSAKKK